ncbi:Nn.00g025190.m01.CDS01 [Neocucurbitaria sp. VM-36]
MDSAHQYHPVSPLASPAIRISRPEYASVPARSSDDSSESRRDKRSRFEENIDPGLGIRMIPMASPKSPGVTHYRQDSSGTKHGIYSPMISPGPRPLYQRTPDTLYSFGSNVTRTRTDPMTERLIAHRATQSTQWHIHWRIPALIAFAFFMGIVLALLQHFLYTYLHHMHDMDEGKKFRWVLYGRALAYLAKVAFGGCVVVIFRQRIWRTFRERALSVLSIDQLFGATEDPSLFANWEAVSNAPILVMIALVIWLIPLATIIFSPGALTFGNYLKEETIELSVPTINFTAESNKDWRNPVKLPDGSNKRSVMFYNTTDIAGTAPGWFDYYDQPSAELRRIAILLAYSNMDHPNIAQGARQDNCGKGFNCTYEQSFIASGYQCSEVASGYGDTGRLKEYGAPFNMSMLVPEGRYVYFSEVDQGAYARPQVGEFQKGPGGLPVGEPDPNLGVFKSEPVLWIGYSVNSTELVSPDDPLAKNWTHRYDPAIIRCVHMETNYTVKWDYIEPFFHVTTKREYLAPIVDTNFTLWDSGQPNLDDPQPQENWISPRNDVALYKKTAAYHAIGDMFRDFLRGHVDLEAPIPGPYYAQVYSDVTKTRLVEKNSEPKKNLTEEIEAFYSDMVLSLFSAPEMLAIDKEKITVNRTQIQSAFIYVPERLWQCYAPVIFVTLVIMLFGAFTIWEDGTTFSVGFSRILVTTRNTTLDDISRGACLGNDPFPMELMHTRLKFGVLAEGSEVEYMGGDGYQGVGHCAFGVASEVGPIRRGVPYAGLPDSGLKRRKIIGKMTQKEMK